MNTFTIEETNLLSIYKTDDKWEMLTNMAAALPLMDGEMRAFAERTIKKPPTRSSKFWLLST